LTPLLLQDTKAKDNSNHDHVQHDVGAIYSNMACQA